MRATNERNDAGVHGQVEHVEFDLPIGLVDDQGRVHRRGVMRPARAIDEVAALEDPRAKKKGAYAGIVLMSRVVTQLGAFAPVSPALIEQLLVSDYAYLQELYLQLNQPAVPMDVECPDCQARFYLDFLG